MAKNQGFFAKSGPSMMVLLILKERARYGYEIAKELEQRSDHDLSFQFGTLYPILHKLEQEGFIVGVWEHPEGERARRIYQLTEKGELEAEQQVEAWIRYSEAVNRVIRGVQREEPLSFLQV